MKKSRFTKVVAVWISLVAILLFCFLFVLNNKAEEGRTDPEIKKNDHVVNFEEENDTPLTLKNDEGVVVPQKEYTSEEIKTTMHFNAIAPIWSENLPEKTTLDIFIRSRLDKEWTEWYKVDKADGKDNSVDDKSYAEAPLILEGTSFQYRVNLTTGNLAETPELKEIRFIYYDTRGERHETSLSSRVSAAPSLVSRSGWSCPDANGTLFQNDPNKYWPPTYTPIQKFIIHHTAGQNNPTDPSAAIRAIWSYHSYERGWGDIGYNYVVDQFGRIYEGRFGGESVIAGHTLGYNSGSMGIAVLGDFSSYSVNQDIKKALSEFIGYKGSYYGVNPIYKSVFEDKNTYNIDGHQNYTPTACPGSGLYAELFNVRSSALPVYEEYFWSNSIQVTESLNLSDITPALGQTVTATAKVKNVSGAPVTLNSVGVASWYKFPQFNPRDFGFNGNVTLSAGEEKTLSFSRRFTEVGDYRSWIVFSINGKIYEPSVASGKTRIVDFRAHVPDIRVTSPLTLNPSSPATGQVVTATMTLRNYELASVNLETVGIANWSSSPMVAPADFGFTSNLVLYPFGDSQGRDIKTISYSRTFNSGGVYGAWGVFFFNGVKRDYPGTFKGYQVVEQLALLTTGGYSVSIPATSGLVAREQHLYLNATEAALGKTAQSAALHYGNSGTPLAAQNGMAGGYGAFGANASYNLPLEDERYYITMRWYYVTWYEAPDGTCSTVDGRLDTCTSNYNGSLKTWHYRKKVIITNPANGKRVVASVMEAGPAIWTGRVAGLSPEAMLVIGAATNNNLNYYWAANQSLPLGPLN